MWVTEEPVGSLHCWRAGFGCSLGPRAVLPPAKGPLGRASGGVGTGLLLPPTPPLHFATSTGSKPPRLGLWAFEAKREWRL
ncbi:hypothetical protein AV530_007322 [Patagioenas fasciata monilis]|uniref:Uncharacterized protein n=1 Tax=Patagioenas fasciata monilis TaxID=372326 RepID=A0A1V4JXE2_PATFA|nr:hypothetical protein AV530_007322 [Patagioenas fasciata monilis]